MCDSYPFIIGAEYDKDIGVTDFVFESKLEALTTDDKMKVLEKLLTCAEYVKESIDNE